MDDEKAVAEKMGQPCQATSYLNVQKSKLSGRAGRDNLQPSQLNLVPTGYWLQRQFVNLLFFVGLRMLRNLIYHVNVSLIPKQPSAVVKSQISEAGQI